MHAMRYFRDTRSPNCNSTLRKASYQNLSSLFAPQAGDKSFILLEKVSSRACLMKRYCWSIFIETTFLRASLNRQYSMTDCLFVSQGKTKFTTCHFPPLPPINSVWFREDPGIEVSYIRTWWAISTFHGPLSLFCHVSLRCFHAIRSTYVKRMTVCILIPVVYWKTFDETRVSWFEDKSLCWATLVWKPHLTITLYLTNLIFSCWRAFL